MKLCKPRALLRAVVELANAANGVRPLGRQGYITLPAFAFGWPTSELSPLYLGESVLDAVRRGVRGDFKGWRGRIALGLTAIAWGLLWLIHHRNVRSEPYFEAALRDALGDDYEATAAQSQPARRRSVTRMLPNELTRRRYVEKAGTVRYGPHPKVNFADIWRRRDLPRDARAPVLLQVPGGAWAIGMRRPQAYPLLSHLAERGWVCLSIDYRVSPKHTWPDHIIDVKRALAWIKENIARVRRRSRLHRHHRRLGGRSSGLAGRAHPERSAVSAGFRGRRHLGGRRGADLRPLRLVHHRRHRPAAVHRIPAEVRGQEAVRRAQADLPRRVADQPVTP